MVESVIAVSEFTHDPMVIQSHSVRLTDFLSGRGLTIQRIRVIGHREKRPVVQMECMDGSVWQTVLARQIGGGHIAKINRVE